MLKIVQQKLVGVAGFEPTTSASRTRRATKLRYTPKLLLLAATCLIVLDYQ
jgi:hypothetical protein